jgi:UbiD family decarboxylase
MSDLRTFLDLVRTERKSDYLEVERSVSPRHETAGIIVKLEEKQRSPIVVFRDVEGSRFPVVTNVCGSIGRIALGLGVGLRDVGSRYAAAIEAQHAPRMVDTGPVHEHVLRDEAVDLGVLPKLVYHADDTTKPYVTAAIVIARDPELGTTNLSYHRLMIDGARRTGIFIEKGKHLDRIYRKYVSAGRAMPIAAFVGHHPAWSLGALYSGPDEEMRVIGGLLGAPLEVVRCLTQPELFVPARAELVLEGYVPPDERMPEGPFGEVTGFATGATETPVFHVTAMTWREGMLFQDIIAGRMEHLVLSMPAVEYRTLADARSACPGVVRVALPAPLTTVVALEKLHDDEPGRVLDKLLGADIYTKHVIVVDADVDPSDMRAVMAAVALTVQADRRVRILADQPLTPLDPSCPSEAGRGAKMGIDATRPCVSTRTVTRNRIPEDVLARIDVAELLRKK